MFAASMYEAFPDAERSKLEEPQKLMADFVFPISERSRASEDEPRAG